MQNEGTFGVIFFQNRSFETVRTVNIGDIVWIPAYTYAEQDLIGPLFVVGSRDIGYGSNRREIWKCHDISKDQYYEMEKIHLYRPGEF